MLVVLVCISLRELDICHPFFIWVQEKYVFHTCLNLSTCI